MDNISLRRRLFAASSNLCWQPKRRMGCEERACGQREEQGGWTGSASGWREGGKWNEVTHILSELCWVFFCRWAHFVWLTLKITSLNLQAAAFPQYWPHIWRPQPQTVSVTADYRPGVCVLCPERWYGRVSVCLSITVGRLFSPSFIFFSGSHKHSSCVCGFRSNHNRSCALWGLTGADYISSSGWGPLGSHAGAFTLCVNFTVSGRFCPISVVGLLVEINSSSQERMRPVLFCFFLFCFFAPPSYPSTYILITLQSWGAPLSLGKTAA